MNHITIFHKQDYVYDEYYDCVLCPQDQVLKYATTNRDGYREYKSNPQICKNCFHLSGCTKSKNHKKTAAINIWENYTEILEDYSHTYGIKEIYEKRNYRKSICRFERKTRHEIYNLTGFG